MKRTHSMKLKGLKKVRKDFGLLWQALRKFNDDNGFFLSSGITFNILINLIPFILENPSRQPHTVRFSTHSLHALRFNMHLISLKSPSVICREKCPRRKDFSVLDSNVKILKILNIHSME